MGRLGDFSSEANCPSIKLSDEIFFDITSLQFDTKTRPGQIRTEIAVHWLRGSFKKHLLNPRVIMKILNVPRPAACATNVLVQGRRGMCGKRNLKRIA